MSIVLAVVTWKRNQSIGTDSGQERAALTFPKVNTSRKSDLSDSYLLPTIHTRLGFAIFAWESTYKDFTFCLFTELHFVHTLLKYESLYIPALACYIIRVKLGVTLQRLSSPRINIQKFNSDRHSLETQNMFTFIMQNQLNLQLFTHL